MFLAINLKKFKKVFIVFLILIVLLFLSYSAVKVLFPVKHLDLINEFSEKYSISPALLCAMINTESRFNSGAKSHKNAEGLMQLMKITADWGAEDIGLEDYDYSKITEPKINIEIGSWYIAKLINQYDQNINTALAAYNAGSGTVSSWLNDEKYSTDGKELIEIPYSETKKYVKKVNLYKYVYEIILKFKIY